MERTLFLLTEFINNLHDLIIKVFYALGFKLSDADLHFWIIGVIGIVIFIFIDLLFKQLAKLNVSVISFLFTLTVLIVFVFGLEIEQKITGRGNMEFSDIVAGLWGFFALFAVYLALRILIYGIKLIFKR